MRLRSTLTSLAAASLLLAACGDDAETPDPDAAPEDDAIEEGLEDELGDELDGDLEDELLGDAEDPNDFVADGVFQGQGILLPVPDGFELDEFAFAQGAVVAMAGESQQLAAEAIDIGELPDEQQITYDEVIEQNLAQIPEEPVSDEEVELEGAAQARALQFDDLAAGAPAGEAEGEAPPETTALIVFAEDGSGQLAVFNYLAETAEFDQAVSDELLAVAGFDPDSDPTPPAPVEGP